MEELDMARFTLPRDLYYGKGSLAELKNLKGSKAVMVLGGGSMKRFGFVDKALSYLKEAGIETKLFENVESFLKSLISTPTENFKFGGTSESDCDEL